MGRWKATTKMGIMGGITRLSKRLIGRPDTPSIKAEMGLMMRRGIDIPMERVAEFCKRNHIRRLALFGSVLRKDFGPQSDVDVLVEFEPGHVPGLAFFGMQEELSALLGRNVDLNTPQFLSRYFREKVLSESGNLWAA